MSNESTGRGSHVRGRRALLGLRDDVPMDIARRYLEIVLRLRRLAPGLVESYVGPREIEARIEAEPLKPRPRCGPTSMISRG
jgi:hypothetical protein